MTSIDINTNRNVAPDQNAEQAQREQNSRQDQRV